MAKLSESTKKQLRAIARKQAEKIVEEFEEKMCKKYESLIQWYYDEPYQTNPPHYPRTGNLRKSYSTFTFISEKKVTGSFMVTGQNMNDYGRKQKISGERYLEKYFFSPSMPSTTWHGGDWHGGYGVMANFSAYEEMTKFYLDTVKDFRKKYGI